MKHSYNISGMTCGNCKASVENYLKKADHISSVSVNLKEGTADLIMDKHIPTIDLQKNLPEKYTITDVIKEKSNSNQIPLSIEHEKNKFQQLRPLFLILLYIGVTSNLIHLENWSLSNVMVDFMGLFYIVFSFFKMLDLKGFPESFRMYDPLAKRSLLYAKVYPFIETTLGLMLLMRFEVKIALMVTLIILGITTIGVTKTLLDKKTIRCACLGTALKLPMTEATFIENAIMIVMAIIMLI